jgi:hypothetical protein
MPFDLDKEMAALGKMTACQLAERFAEIFGETTHSRHKAYLIRKILWKLQARETGDLSERALKRAKELAADAELRVMPPPNLDQKPIAGVGTTVPITRDRRLPVPGTSLVRDYLGRRVEVVVRADGFEFEGERFRSLSAVARKITGTHCNGFRFFNLEGGK